MVNVFKKKKKVTEKVPYIKEDLLNVIFRKNL